MHHAARRRLIEEAPSAYKPVGPVLRAQEEAGPDSRQCAAQALADVQGLSLWNGFESNRLLFHNLYRLAAMFLIVFARAIC